MIKLTPILKQILKEEDDEWNFTVDPWTDISPDFQELIDLVGIRLANQWKDIYQDQYSPKEIINRLNIEYKDVFEKFDPSKINLKTAREYFLKEGMNTQNAKNDQELLDFYRLTFDWQFEHFLNIFNYAKEEEEGMWYYDFGNRENQNAFEEYLFDINFIDDDWTEWNDIVYHPNWWGFPQLYNIQLKMDRFFEKFQKD
jgi:hypothetical protein